MYAFQRIIKGNENIWSAKAIEVPRCEPVSLDGNDDKGTGLRHFSKDDRQKRKMIARINNYNHSCLKEC